METLDDRHEVYQPYTASCSRCRQEFNSIDFTCQAFPEGIPEEILAGDNKHRVPIKDQVNNLVFSLFK